MKTKTYEQKRRERQKLLQLQQLHKESLNHGYTSKSYLNHVKKQYPELQYTYTDTAELVGDVLPDAMSK